MDDASDPSAAPAAGILVADLVYDTAAGARPAGVRSGLGAGARRLLFAVGEVEVLVQLSAAGVDGAVDVAGQVAVGDIPLAGVPVRLEIGDEGHAGTTGRAGGFWFPAPRGAACRLAVSAHGYVVRTPAFRLGLPMAGATAPAADGAHRVTRSMRGRTRSGVAAAAE